MNQTIQLLQQHRTYRHFDAHYQIPEIEIQAILSATQQAPSWMNGQHYSIIRIRDNTIRHALVQLSPQNPQLAEASECWIFVADLYRMHLASEAYEGSFEGSASLDNIMMASVDVALAAQNTAIAAESLGYGTCFVGGVRPQAEKLIELLQLPQFTFPVMALCFGKARIEMQVKPRLPAQAVLFDDNYQTDLADDLAQYEQTMIEFAEARETLPWREKFSRYYHQEKLPQTAQSLQKQGFINSI